MGCNTICRTCEHSNPSRVKDGMIRCLKKHIFVPPTHTCDLHSFHFTMDDTKLKELMETFGKKVK